MTQHSRDTPQFYLTAPSPCPYLTGKEERKVFTHLVGDRAPGLNDLLTVALHEIGLGEIGGADRLAGAELAAGIMERFADSLRAPIVRVASADVPVPFAPVLENLYRPDRVRIASAMREVVGR